MKKAFLLAGVTGLLFLSCKKEQPLTSHANQIQTTQHGDTYAVDTADSKIEWAGYKIFKSENTSNFGFMKFKSGEITVHDGKLESGKFVADVNSLESENLKDSPEQKKDLEDHLKSGDFFETEKYPTATYEISKVDHVDTGDFNSVLHGNLTIKGITKPVSFKANVTVKDGVVSIATDRTDIKREDFGVKFSIPVQNGILKDEVTLQISVKAK